MRGLQGFSLLLATPEASVRLGVSPRRVLALAQAGQFRVAAQNLDGRQLFREHDVARLAQELRDPSAASLDLHCGCRLIGGEAAIACRDASALEAAYRFAAMLAAAMPADALCRQLVQITRAALARH